MAPLAPGAGAVAAPLSDEGTAAVGKDESVVEVVLDVPFVVVFPEAVEDGAAVVVDRRKDMSKSA